MGGMMSNHELEKDFTTLLWLCISMNDILHSPIFSSECIEILETRIQRFLHVSRLMIGDQREFASKAGLRIAKFHGMLHYPQMIKKFGTPLNFWGGALESFLKTKLKGPSKRINRHAHRVRHDILIRSQETRQFSLARRVIAPTEFAISLLVGPTDKELISRSVHSGDNVNLSNPTELTPDVSCVNYNTRKTMFKLPRKPAFIARLNPEGIWKIEGIASGVSTSQSSSTTYNGNVAFSCLYHPEMNDGDVHVRNIIAQAVTKCLTHVQDRSQHDAGVNDDILPGLSISQVEFYYQVTATTYDGEIIPLKCNPIWNNDIGGVLMRSKSTWFDWVEVSWSDKEDSSPFTVPAILSLLGKIIYSDGKYEIIASIRSLQSMSELPKHSRLFFGRTDYMSNGDSCCYVVDIESILSTAFVVPCIVPPDQSSIITSRPMTPAQSLENLQSSQYYVALPPCTQWKNIGWSRKLTLE
jgi:hypothetical protein